MNSLKIHDIKPLVEVNDYSLYLFVSLVLAGVIFIAYIIYFLYTKLINKKKSHQKFYIQELKNMDLTQSKQASYTITNHISNLIKNEQQSSLANDLLKDLEQYKYKKEVEPFNENTLGLYKKFTDTI